MDEPDSHRPLADRGGDPLDGSGADIADGEDPGTAGLEEVRGLAIVLCESPVLDIPPGEQKSVVVGGQLAFQPLGVRRSAAELSTNVVGSAIPPGPRVELGQPDAPGRESPSSPWAVPR